MNKEERAIVSLIIGVIMVGITILGAMAGTKLCYQESVNETTCGNHVSTEPLDVELNIPEVTRPDMESFWDMAATDTNATLGFDGDWSTHVYPGGFRDELGNSIGNYDLYLFYYKPENLTQAVWQVKGEYGNTRNFTISPTSYPECWNAGNGYDNRIFVNVRAGTGFGRMDYECWYGTGWTSMNVTLTELYNDQLDVYEEAIWWETSCTPNWNCTGHTACVKPALISTCTGVVDLNACDGETYTGDYSEFTLNCTYPPSGGGGGGWPEEQNQTGTQLAVVPVEEAAINFKGLYEELVLVWQDIIRGEFSKIKLSNFTDFWLEILILLIGMILVILAGISFSKDKKGKKPKKGRRRR